MMVYSLREKNMLNIHQYAIFTDVETENQHL